MADTREALAQVTPAVRSPSTPQSVSARALGRPETTKPQPQAAHTSSCECPPVGERSVDQATAHIPPFLGIALADNDHIGKET